MKKLLAALALAVVLVGPAPAAVAGTILPTTVTVPASSSAVVRLSAKCYAVRIKAPVTGLSARLYEERRSVSGGIIGYFPSCPPDTLAGASALYDHHMVPAPGDTVLPLDPESVLAWNTYNDVVADLVVIHNSNGSPYDVEVQAWH